MSSHASHSLPVCTVGLATAALVLGVSWSGPALTAGQSAAAPSVAASGQGQGGRANAGRGDDGQAGRGRGGRGGRGGNTCQPLAGSGCVPSTTPMLDDPANAIADLSPKPPVLPKSAAEEHDLFQLPRGYDLELVLAEPHLEEPAAITFDGNGRMYVTEIRGYMNTVDAEGELEPSGRVSRHEDLDNDGVYETHTVFVDNLVFPRFATPFGANAVLTKHSNASEVWLYTDTDNDGVADEKELFTDGYGRAGNLEHQESHMTWALDNWMYSTMNSFRVRWTPHGVIREPTGSAGGQWGLTQDDYGKVWTEGGASGVPARFQLPLLYGNLDAPGQMDPDLRLVWGAPILIGDIRPGAAHMRFPDQSLAISTAGAGADVFRGHRLPQDLRGDYFYGEPVGRIIRRVRPEVREGITYIRNYYRGSEFIRSTDPLFRPVDVATAPDGTIYIVDMYRGIIQHAQWTDVGSYLREKIEQYQLDRIIDHGRIWRLTYDGMERDRTMPRMLEESAADLVAHLDHPNGWWRDTAQQLLVLRQDLSVVPALQAVVQGDNEFGRSHALWTLEGLGALDAAPVRGLMSDPNPRIRVQALRASETLYKAGDRSLADDYRAMTTDDDTTVVIQAMLSLDHLDIPDAAGVLEAVIEADDAEGVQVFGRQMLERRAEAAAGALAMAGLGATEVAAMERGKTIYDELCYSCHGEDGRGAVREAGMSSPGTMAPPLGGSPRVTGHRDYVIKVLLQGITGPLAGRTYDDIMIPMGMNTDEYIASVASYVRNAFGNSAPFVTPADVARVRGETADRTTMWTYPELEASLPARLTNELDWTLSASHNGEDARSATSLQGWQSGAPQEPGMWFQIELPGPTVVSEIQFASPAGGGGRGRGGGRGGRGGGGGEPPPSTAPRSYSLQTSDDGTTWSDPAAEGEGLGDMTTITFEPIRTRFVRLTQTTTPEGEPQWTIRSLSLFGPHSDPQ